MRKAALLFVALLSLIASTSSAATSGLNLAWNACLSDGGVVNRNFACDMNASTNVMVASYAPPEDVPSLTGNEVTIDIISAGATLPAWWQFKNSGTCRTTSLSVSFLAPPTAANCVDAWQGQASGGIGAYNIGFEGSPNRARILLAVAIPAPATLQIPQGQDTFSMSLAVNNQKTVGTACSGCATAVCIVFSKLKLTQPVGVGDFTLLTALDRNWITWQGGAIGHGGCPAATPTRNTTWGAVKSLYR